MNLRNLFRSLTAVVAVSASLMFTTASVSAIPFVAGDQTQASPVPAFNVFTGVPNEGTESDFFRSRVPTGTADSVTKYVDPLTASCENGQRIQMRVYVHNGASATANDNGNGPSVAHGTRVKVALDTRAASSFSSNATISASNAATVNDTSTINCNGKTVKLKYVPGSASSFSKGSGVVKLSDDIIGSGVPIRSNDTEGDVYGCFDQRVFVLISVVVEEIPAPKPVPAISCDLFKIEIGDNRTIRVSQFSYTATNATYKNTILNWDAGTGKTNVSTAVITDGSKVNGQTYNYATDGTYLVTATVRFMDGEGKELVAGTENCQQQVTFTTKQPPVVTPVTTPVTPAAKPTVLVNTGAGSTIAIFAVVSVAATFAYRRYLSSRLV